MRRVQSLSATRAPTHILRTHVVLRLSALNRRSAAFSMLVIDAPIRRTEEYMKYPQISSSLSKLKKCTASGIGSLGGSVLRLICILTYGPTQKKADTRPLHTYIIRKSLILVSSLPRTCARSRSCVLELDLHNGSSADSRLIYHEYIG